MVSAVTDHDSPCLGSLPKKIQGADLLYQPNAVLEKNDLWTKSPPCPPHAIRVLIYSYVLAAAQDPDENQRMSLSSALPWMGPIGKLVFLGSRSQDPLFARITEAESAARTEWPAMSQRGPMSTMSEIVMECGKNLRYPMPSEFAAKVSADAERKQSWQCDSSGFNTTSKGARKDRKAMLAPLCSTSSKND